MSRGRYVDPMLSWSARRRVSWLSVRMTSAISRQGSHHAMGAEVAVDPTDSALGEFWMSKKFVGKLAVITGASTGIGLATAKRLVCEGIDHVFITGRRKHVLELRLPRSEGT